MQMMTIQLSYPIGEQKCYGVILVPCLLTDLNLSNEQRQEEFFSSSRSRFFNRFVCGTPQIAQQLLIKAYTAG